MNQPQTNIRPIPNDMHIWVVIRPNGTQRWIDPNERDTLRKRVAAKRLAEKAARQGGGDGAA